MDTTLFAAFAADRILSSFIYSSKFRNQEASAVKHADHNFIERNALLLFEQLREKLEGKAHVYYTSIPYSILYTHTQIKNSNVICSNT